MDTMEDNKLVGHDPFTAIQHEIYMRFLVALARLKKIQCVTDELLSEVGIIFFGEELSRIKFVLLLSDKDYLVETALLTGLMEASKSWAEFEKLHQQQKDGEEEFQKLVMGISD